MAGSEPRLGITWMNMHTQSATNRRRSQEQERDLHAYNPGAGRPEFVQSQSLAPIASKKFGLSAFRPISSMGCEVFVKALNCWTKGPGGVWGPEFSRSESEYRQKSR